MLRFVAAQLKDVAILRRLLFAVMHIPRDLPNFWGMVVEFATFGKVDHSSLGEYEVKMLVENLEVFESNAFATDRSLLKELIEFKSSRGRAFGIVLISDKTSCVNCGGKLLLRKDRPASLVLYDDSFNLVLFRLRIFTNIVAIAHAVLPSTMVTTQQVVVICKSSIMLIGAVFHTLLPLVKPLFLLYCSSDLTVKL